MANILMAWELGGGRGHLERLRVIAGFLQARGHSLSMVCNEPRPAHQVFHPLGIPVYPAPELRRDWGAPAATDSYAQLLLGCGYAKAPAVGAMLRAWRRGFERLQPALVLADFAPTAMLAARLDGVRVAVIGQGYTLPPPTRPLPFTRAWEAPPVERLALLDTAATASINAALVDAAGPGVHRLAGLADLFDVDASFLCTFRELDHYVGRGEADYYGPVFGDSRGVAPEWPDQPGPRLFAYLNAAHPLFRTVVSALRQSGIPVLLYARGLAAAAVPEVAGSTLRVSLEPVHMQQVLADCDAVLCQGIGTVAAALLAGRPVLVAPEHLEQDMVTYRVHQQALGVGLVPGATEEMVQAALRVVLDATLCRDRAVAFARYYHGFSPAMAAEAIAEICHDLCNDVALRTTAVESAP
ncbi:MAG: hypothetical protein U1E70_29625 [Acetobacteraceae bacterium]